MHAFQFPTHIQGLKPYVPGLPIEHVAQQIGMDSDDVIKLASNENPLGASPKALQALAQAAIDLSRYPDADISNLSATLAKHHDIPADWVVVGAGSEAVLGMVTSTMLCPGRSAVFSEYSFQAFVNGVQRSGGKAVLVPSPDLTVDLQGLREAIRADTTLVYVANPGNPTGTLLEPSAIHEFLSHVPSHVVVMLDEAYHEYVPSARRGDAIKWVRQFPNLIVTRTFSKAYGLAGLRVGYGVSQKPLADMLKRVRAPFSVTHASQVAAAAALADTDFLAQTITSNTDAKQLLEVSLERMELQYLKSYTNFVLVKVGSGASVASALKSAGIIVRPVDNYALTEWVRISIGNNREVQRLVKVLEGLMPLFKL